MKMYNVSDHCSYKDYLSTSENKAWKFFDKKISAQLLFISVIITYIFIHWSAVKIIWLSYVHTFIHPC